MEKKGSKKILAIVTIIILIIILVISATILYRYTNRIKLTQFAPQTVSQMMGYRIITPKGKVIIIDGGTKGDSKQLQNAINEAGGTVDAWFFTHPHEDHTGAFIDIIENTDIKINKIYTSVHDIEWYRNNDAEVINENEDFLKALENEKVKGIIQEPKVNEQIKIDNVIIEILGIKNPEITENAGNNSSMVMKFYINDKSILFLGDTGKESCEKLIQTQKEKLKSNIVQMAHHGQSGATEEFYKIVQPEICLWPTPLWLWNNDSGNGEDSGSWKTKETRAWVENLNVKENYIAKDGIYTIEIW